MADYPGATYNARTVAELQALNLGGGSPTHAEYDIEVADEVEAVETDLRAAIADGAAATSIQDRLLEMDAATATAVTGASTALATHAADQSTHGVASEIVGISEAQTLSNKTFALGSNSLSGTIAQFNTALTDGNFATLDGAETLTQKNLTAPTIADFTNAQHDHGDADDGGQIPAANIPITDAGGFYTATQVEGALQEIAQDVVDIPELAAGNKIDLATAAGTTTVDVDLSEGKSGGETLVGGSGSGDDLTLESTSHATPGSVFLGRAASDDNVVIRSTSAAIGVWTNTGVASTEVGTTGGTAVLALATTQTNDDNVEIVRQDRITTTDATVTTLVSVTIPTDAAFLAEARVVARRTGGSSGTAGDSAGYFLRAAFKNVGGTASLIGSVTVEAAEDQSGWAATMDATGATMRVRVTGAANNNITWHATIRYSYLGS